MEKEARELGGKTVTVYGSGAEGAPTVYASMYMEAGERILEACKALGCPAFDLVSLSDLHWDEDLSPWASPPVVSDDDRFTGGSDDYARYLADEVVPYAEGVLGHGGRRIIAGYSMGGLFALYAPYVTDAFSACVSASGSVWFQGFLEFARNHPFVRRPDAAYLSIGDRESRTSNPHLRTTEDNTRALRDLFESRGVESTFELNPGNHFQDADRRLAKGIAWVLTRRRPRRLPGAMRHTQSKRKVPWAPRTGEPLISYPSMGCQIA